MRARLLIACYTQALGPCGTAESEGMLIHGVISLTRLFVVNYA